MHYREIANQIVSSNLTKSVGATPAHQANSALRSLVKAGKVAALEGAGMYALPEVANKERQHAEAEDDADFEAATDTNRLTVKAYGLYWSRALVDWDPANGRLLGSAGSTTIDFADQDGVYLLHSGNEIAYVGQSYTPNQTTPGLYGRLRSHHTDFRKTDRWDSFSWFGFKPVDSESQTLLPTPNTATAKEVFNLLEAILIEGLMPRLNMRAGEDTKEWLKDSQYSQIEDPYLIMKRLAALGTVGQVLR